MAAHQTPPSLGFSIKWIQTEEGEFLLPVVIRADSRLYELATQINHRSLPVGVYYAKMICDGTKQQIYDLMGTGFETKVIPCNAKLAAQA